MSFICEEKKPRNRSTNENEVKDTSKERIQWYQSKEIKICASVGDSIDRIPRNQIISLDYNGGLKMTCLSAKEVLTKLKEKSDEVKVFDVLKADEKHSDLVPGEYEGGLKVWECTKDMVVQFLKNEVEERKDSLSGKSVLDLGCGSGILGIMCLLHGATVTFQDYNEEVLEAMTIPNIFLNCNGSIEDKVRLYSGDWSSFLNLILTTYGGGREGYDYILTSETIYNPDNYQKIITVIKSLLKSDGVCYVGAKMNYFGVGGSLKEFQSLIQGQGMLSELCWEATEGVARGILKIVHVC